MSPGQLAVMGLLMMVAVAGCVGGGAAKTEPGPSVAPPASFDVETGGIQGLVHDDSLAPIASAQVALADSNHSTVTDATGVFSFSNIAPGDYQIFAAALGYEAAASRVNVVAGQVTSVDLQLVTIPIDEPWESVLTKRGIFGCGASWRPQDPVTGGGIAACGVLSLYGGNTQFDEFYLAWELPGVRPDMRGMVFETVWQSNQVLGQGLWPLWEPLNCGVRFAQAEGRSPVRTWLGEELLAERFEAADDSSNDACQDSCDEDKCEFQSRMFPSAQSLGPSYPADISIQVQQVYTNHLSSFYHEQPPVDFTATTDA